MARVLCHHCGCANPQAARFCAACGRSSPDLGSGDARRTAARDAAQGVAAPSEQDKKTIPEQTVTALTSLPPGDALLVVTGSSTVSTGFRMDAELLTVGRHPGSDLVLDDPSVSRHHAEFRRRGRTYAVRDLGGRGGTYVNHERVEEEVLTSRDEIRLGRFHLVFLAP